MRNKYLIYIVISINLAIHSTLVEATERSELLNQPRLPDILSHRTIISKNFLPDYSYAGYENGNQNLPRSAGKVIWVDELGASANDEKDDSIAILAAITQANAHEGPVILRFSPGRYRITEILPITRGDIVIQGHGSGEGGTTLFFPRPLDEVDGSESLNELREYLVALNKRQREPDKNIDEYFSEYSWSGGFIWVQKPGTRAAPYLKTHDPQIKKLTSIESGAQGEKSITVKSTAQLNSGDIIQIQWINRQGPEAGIIKSLYHSESGSAGSHHWSFPNRPLVRQTTRVESVDGLTVTIADPLLHKVAAEIPAQIAAWDHIEQVGIEGFSIEFPHSPYQGHHLESGYNAIYLTSVYNSWVRDIRISNADAGVLTYNSANVTIQDIRSEGDRPGHYAVHMGNVHNVLAERVIVSNPVIHSLTFNTQSTKCVYKDSEVFVSAVLDQHAGANHQNLFDNLTLHVTSTASDEGPEVTVFDGSGAGYWQPGHGAYNTSWNVKLRISGSGYPDETVIVRGVDEGPHARIIGLHGNRPLRLDYRPTPYVSDLNSELHSVPSLYDHQLAARLRPEEPKP